jgi:twitching motility protein PilT
MNLRAVLSQHLVPADGVAAMSQNRKEKRKRILLSEILQMTPATSNLVAKGQFQNLRSFMETGSKFGMQTLEENLFGWIQSGHLSKASALSFTRNKKVLEQRINRGRDAVQKNRNHKPR